MLYEKVPIYAKTCSSSWVFVLATKRNSVLGQLRGGEGRRRGIAPPSSIRVPRRISLPEGGTTSLRTRLRIRAAGKRASWGRLRDLWRSRDESTGLSFSTRLPSINTRRLSPSPQTSRGPQAPPFHDERIWGGGRPRTGRMRDGHARDNARTPHKRLRASRTPPSAHSLTRSSSAQASLLANAGPAGVYSAPPR